MPQEPIPATARLSTVRHGRPGDPRRAILAHPRSPLSNALDKRGRMAYHVRGKPPGGVGIREDIPSCSSQIPLLLVTAALLPLPPMAARLPSATSTVAVMPATPSALAIQAGVMLGSMAAASPTAPS